MAKKKKEKMNVFDWIAIILLIVGGLNWGLFGIFSFNLVEFITFDISWLARTIYTLVGISALYSIVRGLYFLLKRLF